MRLDKKEKERSHQMKIRRTFSQEFKKETAEAVITGKAVPLELSRKYGISPVIISRWKKEYYAGKFFENKNQDYARFEIRVKELKRMVGRLTMENDTIKEIVKLVEPQKNKCRRYLHRPIGKY